MFHYISRCLYNCHFSYKPHSYKHKQFYRILTSFIKKFKSNYLGMSKELEHHIRREYCTTRPKYRQGKKLTAVKAYTVANESIHLLVFGVPKVNLQGEIRRKFIRYGPVEFSRCITDEISKKIELEQFTDVFHVRFTKLEHARRAKRFLDAQQFYGGILHISYAPEYESVDELRAKLEKRRMEVRYRLRVNQRENEEDTEKTKD